MFRAFSRPSSGAQWLQWQPLVLPSYRGESRAVFVVGPAGGKTPETRWAVNKCQDNKLENCCILLVIYLNCTMMHGLTNFNLKKVNTKTIKHSNRPLSNYLCHMLFHCLDRIVDTTSTVCFDMIYLTAIGWSPGGSSTVHIYIQTVQRTTQTIYRTSQKVGRVRTVPRLCGFYPGICLTNEEKVRKNLSQGSHT